MIDKGDSLILEKRNDMIKKKHKKRGVVRREIKKRERAKKTGPSYQLLVILRFIFIFIASGKSSFTT